MASTVVSNYLHYNPPVITTHCGVVFCSEKFDFFSLNCTKCSQEFNLLSFNLFIKHVKTCLCTETTILENRPKDILKESNQDLHTLIIKHGNQPNSGGDLHYTFSTSWDADNQKIEVYSNAENTDCPDFSRIEGVKPLPQDVSAQGESSAFDPPNDLKTIIKEENAPTRIKNCRSNDEITLALIDEYKKRPVLWNEDLRKKTPQIMIAEYYQEITNKINSQFNMRLTLPNLRQRIFLLRRKFKEASKKKKEIEERSKKECEPSSLLWYYDKISFIDQSTNSKPQTAENCETEKDEETDPLDTSMISEPLAENTAIKHEKANLTKLIFFRQENVTSALIEQYKKRESLWNEKSPLHKDKYVRKQEYMGIAEIISKKFQTNITQTDIRLEIVRLRSKYKRAQRMKDNGHLWFYKQLSFIDQDEKEHNDEIQDSNLDSRNATTDENKATESEDSENSETTSVERNILSRNDQTAMVQLFKSHPCLWDRNDPLYNDQCTRKTAYKDILSILENEYSCILTSSQYRYHIRYMRCSYERFLNKSTSDDHTYSNSEKPWFFDLLSFLEPFTKQPVTTNTSKIYEDIKFLTENKTLMTDFIDEYKSHGCLWDTGHKDVLNSSAKKEAFEKLLNMFSERNIQITTEQLNAAIKYVHSCKKNKKYQGKAWFYNQLEFLDTVLQRRIKFCSHCNKEFRSLTEFEKHKLEIGDYPYKCEICGLSFISRLKYKYHQSKHKEPFECEECNYKSHGKTNYIVHMRRHKGIHKFSCKTCEKKFVTNSELKQHNLMHTGEKRCVCDVCGKRVSSISKLTTHLESHRAQRDYKCEQCGSAFITMNCLREHIETHSIERRHVCKICGAKFKQNKTLRQHAALHLSVKKHSCKICGKLFAQNAGLSSHMKTHGVPFKSSFV